MAPLSNRFFVDGTPIRVFKNTTEKGESYPTKPMRITATIWASGGVPVNWNDAPFEVNYQEFSIDGCQVQNTSNKEYCNSSNFWWNTNKYWELNHHQKQAYNDVRSKYFSL
uniref:Xyloglucan endotransglucosylase/hydrolase protein 1 n=1 Tax=Cicer arietinum TaxID=3827 RepID=A0A1S2XWB8_CICAR|nr:putative xyloglucan endotransglucosylase/hydrolase protein 1 [Cicer arietinum]